MHNPNLTNMDTPFTPSPTLTSTLNTPVQNPAWSQGVAERVAWMVQGNFQSAELKLNPANLGPLEIKLSVSDDKQASITFVSHHAPVREALDAAMPRLRDMLESQGLNLSDVNVADAGVQGNQGQAADQQGQGGSGSGMPMEQSAESVVQESIVPVQVSDGVSIYA
jgi:flagellar hook-length control protein FliK